MHRLLPLCGVQGKNKITLINLSHSVSADSERFPIMAAGEIFNCENDGSIYDWIDKPNGVRRKSSVPLCAIEAWTRCLDHITDCIV